MVNRPYKPKPKNLPQAQLDPHLQRRRATWRDSEIQEQTMWGNLGEDQIHQALSIAVGVEHPLWDGLGQPSKNAVVYMQALQGKNGRLFKDALNRATENHTALVKGAKHDARISQHPYSNFFDWWRQYLLRQNLAMVLPFRLASAGEPFFTPSDKRLVQRVDTLYVYGSDSKEHLYLPSFVR